MQRRLAAILAADVVDYSRLMNEDQAAAISALRQLRSKHFEPVVNRHNGTVIKRMGDGWIVEFASVFDAVACALAVQKGLDDHDLIRLRIGIHTGEVVFEAEDLFGDGVNIAARLEALAQAGGVLISDTAHHGLDGKMARRFTGGEAHELKGIARPVGVWRWPPEGARAGAADKSEAIPGSEMIKLAFLGLQSSADAGETGMICEGVNEAIRTALASQSKLALIADEEKADLMVTGTLQIVGQRYRATVRLQHRASSEMLRAEKFDGQFEDVFEVEDNLAGKIYAFIRDSVFEFEQDALANIGGPLESMDSETLLIKAAPLFPTMQAEEFLNARKILDIVLQRDPDNKSALSLAAITYDAENICGWREASDEDRQTGMALIRHLTSIHPRGDFAHAALSMLLLDFEKDYSEAIFAAEKSLEITPNYFQGQIALGNALVCSGQLEAGLKLQSQGLEAMKSQRFFAANMAYFALGLILAKRFDEVLDWCRRADQQVDNVPNILLPMISAASHSGHSVAAEQYAERLRQNHPGFNLSELRAWPLKNPQHWDYFTEGLRMAGLPQD